MPISWDLDAINHLRGKVNKRLKGGEHSGQEGKHFAIQCESESTKKRDEQLSEREKGTTASEQWRYRLSKGLREPSFSLS